MAQPSARNRCYYRLHWHDFENTPVYGPWITLYMVEAMTKGCQARRNWRGFKYGNVFSVLDRQPRRSIAVRNRLG